MMMISIAVIGALPLCGISTISEAKRALRSEYRPDAGFVITGTVAGVSNSEVGYEVRPNGDLGLLVCEAEEFVTLSLPKEVKQVPDAGDRVVFRGRLDRERFGWNKLRVESFEKLGRGVVPGPRAITSSELADIANQYRPVKIRGILAGVVQDDIDDRNKWLQLRTPDGPVIVAMSRRQVATREFPGLGAEIEVEGLAHPVPNSGRRHFQSPYLASHRITVIRSAPADVFSVQDVSDLDYMSVAKLEQLSLRHATGRVLAVLWPGRVLLRLPSGRVIMAELRDSALPKVGGTITVSGFPSSDMFILHLVSAVYREDSGDSKDEERPQRISAAELFTDTLGVNNINPDFYGRLVTVCGTVVPMDKGHPGVMMINSDGYLVRVRMEMVDLNERALQPGTMVEITAYAVLATDNWSWRDLRPRIRGYELVLRDCEDVRTIKLPSYWTTRRIVTATFSIIVLSLVSVLGVYLRARAVKARARAKAVERTRLAAEIHDSLSQNLSGLAGQIAAAKKAVQVRPEKVVDYLGFAERMLSSSRTELQRCLFDLRGNALESSDIGEAVRKTLAPVCTTAGLNVRFNVALANIHETTVHSVLCIIRELVSNGVVHGGATEIRVAGTKDGDGLRFSVFDNGRGFDPETAPGIAEGHFGLKGIRERLNALGGSIKFESAIPCGTRAVVWVPTGV